MSPKAASNEEPGAIDRELQRQLIEDPSITVRFDLTGKDITTFAIGGALRAVVEVASVPALQKVLRLLNQHEVPFSIVGAGSNLLIDDGGIDRWILRLGSALKTLEIDTATSSEEVCLQVGGAYSLMALSREMCARGYAGLAFAGGIPASLGGAVRMNAGAHGGEISQVVEEVEIVRSDGELTRLTAEEMKFSYRHSVIGATDIVVGAKLRLQVSTPEKVQAERTHCLEERRSRQPLTLPSAGSVFKNPSPEQSAGWLIEKTGLKGHQLGGVEISSKHANWIVNSSKRGSAKDVADLIALCQERVAREFAVDLKPEIITLF